MTFTVTEVRPDTGAAVRQHNISARTVIQAVDALFPDGSGHCGEIRLRLSSRD